MIVEVFNLMNVYGLVGYRLIECHQQMLDTDFRVTLF